MHDSVPSRGVWGHAPPKSFGILVTPRVLLVHFLTSKSSSVYAYRFCHTRKLNMHG